MHCFRHATDEAIAERNSYSEEQKNFFVDYGLTIVKVIYGLMSIFWTQKVKLFYAALLANNSH